MTCETLWVWNRKPPPMEGDPVEIERVRKKPNQRRVAVAPDLEPARLKKQHFSRKKANGTADETSNYGTLNTTASTGDLGQACVVLRWGWRVLSKRAKARRGDGDGKDTKFLKKKFPGSPRGGPKGGVQGKGWPRRSSALNTRKLKQRII